MQSTRPFLVFCITHRTINRKASFGLMYESLDMKICGVLYNGILKNNNELSKLS